MIYILLFQCRDRLKTRPIVGSRAERVTLKRGQSLNDAAGQGGLFTDRIKNIISD